MPPRLPIRSCRPRFASSLSKSTSTPSASIIFVARLHSPSHAIRPSRSRPQPSSPPTSPFFLQSRSLRSILKPAPRSSPYNDGVQPLSHDPLAILARRAWTTPHRTGLLARKAGMSAVFDAITGERIPVTVLLVDRVQVVGHKTLDVHGYWANIVGYGHKPEYRMNAAERGMFKSQGVAGKEREGEFKVKGEEGLVEIGTELRADWFKVGQWVDVQGTAKGKGFAGGMKRHGWSGQPASHGQSLTHRTMGSAGGGQGSGSRVLPGKTMAGNMGNHLHTVQNLEVVKVDTDNGIILVKGPVSGPKKGFVKIQDAKKKPKMAGEMGLPTMPSYLETREGTQGEAISKDTTSAV